MRPEIGVVSEQRKERDRGRPLPAGPPAIDQFDAADPLSEDGCSYAKPQLCTNV